MAELFQRNVPTINEHIKNVYEEGELEEGATIRKFRIVQTEGKRQVTREVDFYNLDVIISVGYRVKSHRGTQFRIWATQRLREYIVKGFVMDDQRLAGGVTNYFDELVERVRCIRMFFVLMFFALCSLSKNHRQLTKCKGPSTKNKLPKT